MCTQTLPSPVRTLDIVCPPIEGGSFPCLKHFYANTHQFSAKEPRGALCRSLGFCPPVKLHPLFEVACPPWNQSCASQLSEVSGLPGGSFSLRCRQNVVSGTNWELQLNWPCFFPFSGDIVCAVFCLMPDHQYFIYSVVADCLMHYCILFRTGSPLVSFLKKFYSCPSLHFIFPFSHFPLGLLAFVFLLIFFFILKCFSLPVLTYFILFLSFPNFTVLYFFYHFLSVFYHIWKQ